MNLGEFAQIFRRAMADKLERGAYEKRVDRDGTEHVTGTCAGCGFVVTHSQPSVIRYHPSLPGGIFHNFPLPPFNCAPTAPDWYGLEDE